MKTCTDCGKEYEQTSNVQKRCADCKAKHKPTGGKVKKPKPARAAKGNGRHDHEAGECEGCKALQMRLDDLTRAEKIMVAAGLVAPEKFEQARKIVRELAK